MACLPLKKYSRKGRFSCPQALATGSAQCSLAPYWFEKLGKEKLTARQLSRAGGYFEVVRGSEFTIVLSAQVKSRT